MHNDFTQFLGSRQEEISSGVKNLAARAERDYVRRVEAVLQAHMAHRDIAAPLRARNPLSLLDAALASSALSPVFPLLPRDKRPHGRLAPNGVLNATRDPDLIRRWWGAEPSANIGGAMGHGVIAVDLDSPGAVEWWASRKAPSTRTTKTASGFHCFFVTDADVPNSARKLAPGVDVRGRGGYVVLPPSIHPDGPIYRLVRDLPVAPCPQWLIEEACRKAPPLDPGPKPQWSEAPEATFRRALAVTGRLLEARPGERNSTLYWAASCFREMTNDGLISRADAERALLGAAGRIGLPMDESRKTIASAIRGGARG
jgi:hypothetical protein